MVSLLLIDTEINSEHQRPSDQGDELHKPIIKKFNKRKVGSSFKDDIWEADLADMQLISNSNRDSIFITHY